FITEEENAEVGNESGSSGLGGGAVAGIVIASGLSLLLILVTAVVCYCYKVWRGRKAGLDNFVASRNEAYSSVMSPDRSGTQGRSITTTSNEAYNVVTHTARTESDVIATSSNEAYISVYNVSGRVQPGSIPTRDNEAYQRNIHY
ncbi:hypothetical protein GBAR_LOCUS31258, partial [Geodia barretti]